MVRLLSQRQDSFIFLTLDLFLNLVYPPLLDFFVVSIFLGLLPTGAGFYINEVVTLVVLSSLAVT